MMEPLWERLLVAAVGPILTAALALFVINWVTARAQRRRESSEIREQLAAELTDCGNTLYFGLQSFWRTAKDVRLADRATDPQLEKARLKLEDLYQKHRAAGKVIEQRLRIYYRDPAPAQNWHSAMSLLSARNFLLVEGNEESRGEIRRRNSGMLESGLSEEQLQNPTLIMSSYRRKLEDAVQSLWICKVDRRGKHMSKLPAESLDEYQRVND
ncbi:hypothetical protein [Arthrobacter sp. ZGTC212]|uniref:hypothetical protein n=1 Tax=Arthrobacter sp. ZGTC212 TaxID=2058899 RepID=UPI000CE46375|nr:hypothetical protein [Arthrobacter sp. ZGTC212]